MQSKQTQNGISVLSLAGFTLAAFIAAGCATTGGIVSTAQAEEKAAKGSKFIDHMFERRDADGDGMLTKQEALGDHLEWFNLFDPDGDDVIVLGDLGAMFMDEDFRAEMRERFRAKMQAKAKRRAEHHLAKLDEDGNGSLSLEEFNARSTTRFAKLDKNEDGVLTADELGQAGGHHGGMGRHHGTMMGMQGMHGMHGMQGMHGLRGLHRLFNFEWDEDRDEDEDRDQDDG